MNIHKLLLNKFRTSGLLVADQALVSGGNFLLGIFLTRSLGLTGFGTYSLFWMGVLFGLSINQAFITKPLLSLAPQEDSTSYLPRVYSLQVGLSLVATVVTFITLFLLQYTAWLELTVSVVCTLPLLVGLHLLYDFCRKYFFLQGQLIWPLVLDGLYLGILFCALFFLTWTDLWSVAAVIICVLIAQMVSVLIAVWKIPTFNTNWREVQETFFQHLHYSKWLVGTALLQWFSGNYFLIAAAAILGPVALGAIRMAQNVIGLLHVIFLAMENIVPVKAATHYFQNGLSALREYLWKITLQVGGLTTIILLIAGLGAKPILQLIYGSAQQGYSYVLVGFCLIYVFVFLGHPLRYALRTVKYTQPIFVAYVWGGIFSVLTAYPLVQRFELYGVLSGLLLTQVIAQIVYLFFLWKKGFFYENYSFGTR